MKPIQMIRRVVLPCCLTIALVQSTGTVSAADQTAAPQTKDLTGGLDPHPPTEISPNANLSEAADFAWKEFIALNWPTIKGNDQSIRREAPNTNLPLGYDSRLVPLVWESYREKVEIFPGTNSPNDPPHGSGGSHPASDLYGYNDPPKYVYSTESLSNGEANACPGSHSNFYGTPWVNLDETSEINIAKMFTGKLNDVAPSSNNSAPEQIRYVAKANKIEYEYVVKNQLWYEGKDSKLAVREKIWTAALEGNKAPNPDDVVTLPDNSIEVKAAWRPQHRDDNPDRFHSTIVRYYEYISAADQRPCYFQADWNLISLHIIQRPKGAKYFVFATFEQADNLTRANGDPLEDDDGNVKAPIPEQPTEPALTYKDDPMNPQVSKVGGFCENPGKRLYFRELPQDPSQTATPAGTPPDNKICVDKRYEAIPAAIIASNAKYHKILMDYNTYTGKLPYMRWLHYKLVNVQLVPFNLADISNDSESSKQKSSYFQSNSVVETDYTLQQFQGRVSHNAPTLYPNQLKPAQVIPVGGIKGVLFSNVNIPNGQTFTHYQMGGCMGCHGNSQYLGHDFSFLVGGNLFSRNPEVPNPKPDDLEKNQELTLARFGNLQSPN